MPTHAKRAADRDGEYGEGSMCFLLSKPVSLHDLDAEITEAMGWRKQAGIVAEGDPLSASEDNYIAIWVLRPDVDLNTVKRVVTAHQEVEDRFESTELDDLRAKVAAGDRLGNDELQAAVRLLLLRG